MTESRTAHFGTFAEAADEYGVETTRVSADALTETIAELVEPPAVGAPLPWDDLSLPESVTTNPTPAELDGALTGVTGAAFAIGEYGSFVLPARPDGSEPVSLFPERHVVVVRETDIVPDMTATFERLGAHVRETGESMILATGPSATADMGALVQGAHGPKEVHGVVVS